MEQINYNQLIEEILEYWFTKDWDRSTGLPSNDVLPKWFGFMFKDGKGQAIEKAEQQEIDKFISSKYKQTVENAGQKKLNIQEELSKTTQGTLALIILLDQFPRNIYRGTKEVFQFDDQALNICKQALKNQEEYNKLTVYEKNFFLLPLCHSEDVKDVTLFTELCEQLPLIPGLRDDTKNFQINSTIKYAKIHLEAVQRFNRYPHRNKILERENTPEEEEYLAKENILKA